MRDLYLVLQITVGNRTESCKHGIEQHRTFDRIFELFEHHIT